ncbi:MAG: protein phosphatase CheZ [Solidesulfovibrio sp. DCME]|uniref:protein phosphatase CheZ n=1 Tax=Solidesulfovibrio sp. DCME TaxID=3447380 RepID=UPI003D0D49EF
MVNDEELVERLLDKILREVVPELRDSISASIEREVAKTLSRTLLESEFHQRLNQEMRKGLQDIYKEIHQAAKNENEHIPREEKQEADKLFQEAAQQLDKILQTTESATTDIMDIVEKHMEFQANAAADLDALEQGQADPAAIARLREANAALGDDLMRIMTTLSFQDLTGQRIKRIIGAIKKVEQIVLDLYLSTGLQMKAWAEEPEKDIKVLEAEAKQKVSELKGPQTKVGQGDVDDLLAQLGLD